MGYCAFFGDLESLLPLYHCVIQSGLACQRNMYHLEQRDYPVQTLFGQIACQLHVNKAFLDHLAPVEQAWTTTASKPLGCFKKKKNVRLFFERQSYRGREKY